MTFPNGLNQDDVFVVFYWSSAIMLYTWQVPLSEHTAIMLLYLLNASENMCALSAPLLTSLIFCPSFVFQIRMRVPYSLEVAISEESSFRAIEAIPPL